MDINWTSGSDDPPAKGVKLIEPEKSLLAGRVWMREHFDGVIDSLRRWTRPASRAANHNTVHLSSAQEKGLDLPMKSLRKQPIARRL
jgi:hypothetical protein